MNKRKILFFLILSIFALFSLSACDVASFFENLANNGENNTSPYFDYNPTINDNPITPTTTTTNIDSKTNTSTTSSRNDYTVPTTTTTRSNYTTTTTRVPTTTTTRSNYTTTTTRVPTTTTTRRTSSRTNQTTQTHSINYAKYYAVVSGNIIEKLINKNDQIVDGKLYRPANSDMEVPGFTFEGFFSDPDLRYSFDFNRSYYLDVVIYARYSSTSKYYELNGDKDYNIASFDFNGNFIPASGTTFDSYDVQVKANTNEVSFDGSSAILTSGNMLVDLGINNSQKVGLFKICFEVTFKNVQGETFFQLYGSSGNGYNKELIALRTSSASLFKYRIDGGIEAPLGNDNNYVSTYTKYEFYIELNTTSGNLVIYQNGEKITSDYLTVFSIDGFKFLSKTNGTTEKVIDNIAVNIEEKQESALNIIKEEGIQKINNYLSSYEYYNLANSFDEDQIAILKLVDLKVADYKTRINNSMDYYEANNLINEWDYFINSPKYVVTIEPYIYINERAPQNVKAYKQAVLNNNYLDYESIRFPSYEIKDISMDPYFSYSSYNVKVNENITLYALVNELQEIMIKADDDSVSQGTAYNSGATIRSDDNIILSTIGVSCNVWADCSIATSDDGTGKSFINAWVQTGTGNPDKCFELKTYENINVTLYYTITNSNFSTINQNKTGALVINDVQVSNDTSGKSNMTAYTHAFSMSSGDAYKLYSSSNRIAIFAIGYTIS